MRHGQADKEMESKEIATFITSVEFSGESWRSLVLMELPDFFRTRYPNEGFPLLAAAWRQPNMYYKNDNDNNSATYIGAVDQEFGI